MYSSYLGLMSNCLFVFVCLDSSLGLKRWLIRSPVSELEKTWSQKNRRFITIIIDGKSLKNTLIYRYIQYIKT